MSNRKSNMLSVCAWFFGLCFVIMSFGFFDINLLVGLVVLVSGILLLPPVKNFILKKKPSLSRGKITVVASILIAISSLYIESSDNVTETKDVALSNNTSEIKEVENPEELVVKVDAEDQFNLAMDYKEKADNEKAIEWFQKAADLGNIEAQMIIAEMYYRGQGVPQSYEKSVEWFQKAADLGNGEAYLALSKSYSTGEGVPQNDKKAFKLLLKAAKLGSLGAQLRAGASYGLGENVEKDLDKAKKWLSQACDNGSEDGCEAYELILLQSPE